MTMIIGIDPGLDGAVALVSHERLLDLFDLPTLSCNPGSRVTRKLDGAKLAAMLRDMLTRNNAAVESVTVYLEDVHVMPKGNAANASLMHTKGVLEGVLAALNYRVQLVGSQRWKKQYGIKADKLVANSAKTQAIELAQVLYPGLPVTLKKHHNRAEAVLIARYGVNAMF